MEVSVAVSNIVTGKLTEAIQGMFQRNLLSMNGVNHSLKNRVPSTPKHISPISHMINKEEGHTTYNARNRMEYDPGVRNIMEDIQEIDLKNIQTNDPPHDNPTGSENMVT